MNGNGDMAVTLYILPFMTFLSRFPLRQQQEQEQGAAHKHMVHTFCSCAAIAFMEFSL